MFDVEAPAKKKGGGRRTGNGRPRIEDVARQAGVAPITVSRALRDPGTVSPATRERIDRAVRAVGYVPNLVAGSLASNRTRLVAALVPNIGNPLFAATLRGLSETLGRKGLHLMVGSTEHSDAEEEALIREFLGQRPCGLVLHETGHTDEVRRLVAAAGVPVVETGDLTDKPLDTVVSYSSFEAAKALTAHLAGCGYRRIALVTSELSARSDRRREGYLAALAEHGLQPRADIMTATLSTFDGGREAIIKLMTRRPRIDAVLFSGNAAAVGALLECQRRGWAVPADVALGCFDDNDLTRQTIPALTAVRIPRYEIGVEAANRILGRLENVSCDRAVVDLGFEVIARDSTGSRARRA